MKQWLSIISCSFNYPGSLQVELPVADYLAAKLKTAQTAQSQSPAFAELASQNDQNYAVRAARDQMAGNVSTILLELNVGDRWCLVSFSRFVSLARYQEQLPACQTSWLNWNRYPFLSIFCFLHALTYHLLSTLFSLLIAYWILDTRKDI